MSTIKALLGDRRQTNTIKQRRKQARDRESREGCCRRGWGGVRDRGYDRPEKRGSSPGGAARQRFWQEPGQS